MITFPKTPEAVIGHTGTLRAGGTDVEDRRRNGLIHGDLMDLRDVTTALGDFHNFDPSNGLYIGALCKVSRLDTAELAPWNGLLEAARTLATPQIRAMATVGGSLLQANRCSYFRHPDLSHDCLKAGGPSCPAREGDSLRLALFESGPCIAVHPSTLGCAFLAYDAMVSIQDPSGIRVLGPIDVLYGDGKDSRDHQLPEGTLLHAIHLENPGTEGSAYGRAIGRVWAEWPLVEATVRRTAKGVVISAGGIAAVPMRLRVAETRINAGESVEAAIAAECVGRTIREPARYKVQLLAGLVKHLLGRIDEGGAQ